MIFGGFDPGAKGAGVFLTDPAPGQSRNTDCTIEFFDTPLYETKINGKTRNRIDCEKLGHFISPYIFSVLEGDCELWMEHLWGFGAAEKGGEIGQFTYAANYGILLDAIESRVGRENLHLIAPTRWQNLLQKPKHIRRNYELSKKWNAEVIAKLYPQAQLIKDRCRVAASGRADALCIAHCARLLHIAQQNVLTRRVRKKRA